MTYTGPSKAELLSARIAKFVREAVIIPSTVVFVVYVSRKDKQLADQFVKDTVAQMRPFTQAVIRERPKALELNMLPALGSEDQRNVLLDLIDAEGELEEMQDEEDCGLALRSFLRFYTGVKTMQVWTLKRKMIKIYAGLNPNG